MSYLPRSLATGLIALSLFLTSRAQTTDVAQIPLPETYFPQLKSILEAAVKESPRMITRQLEEVIAEQSRITARAGLLPSAGGYLNYYPLERDRRADLPFATDTQRLNYNVSINQPLFYWGARKNGNLIGQIQQKIAERTTEEAYRLLVQEIRSSYLQLVIKKVMLARSRLSLSIAKDRLSLAQSNYDKKVISEADMFSPRLNNDQAQLALDRVETDFDDSKRTFSKLIGHTITDAQIGDELPVVPAYPDKLRALYNQRVAANDVDSYTLRNLRSQIEIEKLNYKITAVRLLPTTNVVVGSSQDQQSYTTNIAAKYRLTTAYVGLSVGWNIFDGFSTHAAKTISLTRQRENQQTYDDATANLRDALKGQITQLEYSARAMEIAERILTSSQSGFQKKQDDLKRGLASEADVNAVQLTYYDAQVGALNQRFDYLVRTGDFLSTLMEDPALANLPRHTP